MYGAWIRTIIETALLGPHGGLHESEEWCRSHREVRGLGLLQYSIGRDRAGPIGFHLGQGQKNGRAVGLQGQALLKNTSGLIMLAQA